MVLGDADGGGGGKSVAAVVSCSICLDAVTDNGVRSWAELQCGHKFHLDCIGSAFNVKGAMQCPNCRKVEKGQWLYANGGRALTEFNMDNWGNDEDFYDLSFSEMSFGVQWCPISGLTRIPTSFEEGDFQEFQSSAFRDLLGHRPVFAEHTPLSSTANPCPYIAYLGPIHHPLSSRPSGNMSDGSGLNNHWNGGPSAASEVPGSYPFPPMDVHYHIWDHAPYPTTSNRVSNNTDQPLIPSLTQRTSRSNYDMPRSGMHPFVVSHSSNIPSSALPPFPGPVSRPSHDRPPSHQAYFQQASNSPTMHTSRRSSNHRGLGGVPSDQSGGFYFFSSRPFQEPENSVRDRFHLWEGQVDRDSIWGPFHLPAGGGSRSGGYRQRMASQNWL